MPQPALVPNEVTRHVQLYLISYIQQTQQSQQQREYLGSVFDEILKYATGVSGLLPTIDSNGVSSRRVLLVCDALSDAYRLCELAMTPEVADRLDNLRRIALGAATTLTTN